jgi:C4-dicarboxylate transporter, DctM subunit
LENVFLCICILSLILIGVSELSIVQRLLGRLRVPDAEMLIRHLTLILGMIGGLIAARDKKLLSITSIRDLLPGRYRNSVDFFTGFIGVAVSLWLGVAALQFVLTEREYADTFSMGVPFWWFQAFLPLGFFGIAIRLFFQNSTSTKVGYLIVILIGLLAATVWHYEAEAVKVVWPYLTVLGLACLLGTPIYVAIGGAAVILFWGQGSPVASVSLDHYDQVTNPLLATLPLFTVAGFFLAYSNASRRLVHFFHAWAKPIRGGEGVVTILACAFFTTFTGGSGVTILALGGILLPVLIAGKYTENQGIGLLTGAGSLGILFPPCVPLIVYSIISGVGMNEMFLAGIIPGLLMLTLAAIWAISLVRKPGTERERFSLDEALKATWAAKWELLLPAIPIVLMFGGFALPVNAAAATAFYAFIVEAFVHKELKFKTSLKESLLECGVLVGGVLLILGTAMGLTNFLITEHVPDNVAIWLSESIESKFLFLLSLNIFLIIVGCLMDIFAAIIVITPLLLPVGAAFGIHPMHLGIIILANLELGFLTPPVGLNLFIASYRFNKPILDVARYSIPIFIVLFIGVLLITYFPIITHFLPNLFEH